MSEITLIKKQNTNETPFVVNLQNESDPTKVETYRYMVRRLGGKAAMKVQLLSAEFARDKQRDEIVGSSMLKQILELTRAVDDAPELIELFDFVDDDGLKQLVEGLVKAAQSSTVGDTDAAPAAPKPQEVAA